MKLWKFLFGDRPRQFQCKHNWHTIQCESESRIHYRNVLNQWSECEKVKTPLPPPPSPPSMSDESEFRSCSWRYRKVCLDCGLKVDEITPVEQRSIEFLKRKREDKELAMKLWNETNPAIELWNSKSYKDACQLTDNRTKSTVVAEPNNPIDLHQLPDGPAWLSRLRNADSTFECSAFSAHEMARYVDTMRAAAWPIIRELEQAGDNTDWRDGDETDRVYPWREIKPLLDAVLGVVGESK